MRLSNLLFLNQSHRPLKQVVRRTYVMDQVNKTFVPYVLVVPVNSLVSFPNSDDIRHHVYSFSPAKTFELKLYAGRPKKPVLFDTKGVVVLGCNIHDSMVGYIYVTDKKDVYLTNEKGEVVLDRDLPLNTQLKVWHPDSIMGVDKHALFTINQKMIDEGDIVLVLSIKASESRGTFEELAVDEYSN